MKVKVRNLHSNSSGRPVANQFLITTEDGSQYFQSYETIIIRWPRNGSRIQLDANSWDYSVTTGKYRNQLLGETKRETERKIASGSYELAELN